MGNIIFEPSSNKLWDIVVTREGFEHRLQLTWEELISLREQLSKEIKL